jgi:TIR domain-containing protein
MLVFISWSGRRSKAVAEALETWLAQVIQAVEPFISIDIDKGSRWAPEIADRLERAKVGIICLTEDNLDSKWILFEAGALSKTRDAYVCTLLLDIRSSDVEQPLAQFQHTTTEKEDIYQLLLTINRVVQKSGERSLPENVLRDIFETYWPRLEKLFKESVALEGSATVPIRTEREILQEILEIIRNQERRHHHLEEVAFEHQVDIERMKQDLYPEKTKDLAERFIKDYYQARKKPEMPDEPQPPAA